RDLDLDAVHRGRVAVGERDVPAHGLGRGRRAKQLHVELARGGGWGLRREEASAGEHEDGHHQERRPAHAAARPRPLLRLAAPHDTVTRAWPSPTRPDASATRTPTG